jgi:hypothetical protein
MVTRSMIKKERNSHKNVLKLLNEKKLLSPSLTHKKDVSSVKLSKSKKDNLQSKKSLDPSLPNIKEISQGRITRSTSKKLQKHENHLTLTSSSKSLEKNEISKTISNIKEDSIKSIKESENPKKLFFQKGIYKQSSKFYIYRI